ncbi:UNVERIFIED_CONTAM: hypothetical protein GTU68_035424 [Idotea baltica]|nr:hypothetical protein [Idotea baltica]
MNESKAINVHILDKIYTIACPLEQREGLEKASKYLDQKMREIRSTGKVIGADRIAVMAALNIAHELLNQQDQNNSQQYNAKQQQSTLQKILKRADQVIDSEIPQKLD